MYPHNPVWIHNSDTLHKHGPDHTLTLKAGQGEMAVKAYQRILDNPGVDPVSYVHPMARLGLARAYAVEGNAQASRGEYAAFLEAWKSADADLPVLQVAKAEYAKVAGR